MPPKEELENLYKNNTTDYILKLYKIAHKTLHIWLDFYSIEKKKFNSKEKKPLKNQQDILRLYSEGNSIVNVAKLTKNGIQKTKKYLESFDLIRHERKLTEPSVRRIIYTL